MKSWLSRPTFLRWLVASSPLIILAGVDLASNPGSPWQSVSGVAFSPEGSQLAIGAYGGRFRRYHDRWYLADLVHTVALANPREQGVPRVLDSQRRTGTINMLPEVFIGPCVVFSADGKLVASTAFEDGGPFELGAFRVWEAATGKLLTKQSVQQPNIRTLAAMPQRNVLMTSFRYWVSLWDLDAGSPPEVIEVGMNVSAMAPSPDGARLAVGGLASPEIEICELQTRSVAHRLKVSEDTTSGVTSMAYTADGKTLVLADDESLKFVDVQRMAVALTIPERLVLALAVSRDGKWLATGRYDGVTLWDLPNRKRTTVHWPLPAAESVQFSPDGRLLAAGASDGSVHVWDVASGARVWSWTFPSLHGGSVLRAFEVLSVAVWVFGWSAFLVRRYGSRFRSASVERDDF
jgi:WD40 repeat protein